MSDFGTLLETTLRDATVEQGRIRYGGGRAFVDLSDARQERFPFESVGQALRHAAWDSENRFLAESARVDVPSEALDNLADGLRAIMRDYIDRETDKLGHAFPIADGSPRSTTFLSTGLAAHIYESSTVKFARALVRASLALGSARVAELVGAWEAGRPLSVQTSAILTGVGVADDLVLPVGVSVRTLPSVSDALPLWVPRTTRLPVVDLLEATVLRVDSTISPPLYQPRANLGARPEVQVRSAAGLRSISAVCDALALTSGEYVRAKLFWNGYGELSALGPQADSLTWRSRDPVGEHWTERGTRTDGSTGVVTLLRRKPTPPLLSAAELQQAWEIHADLEKRKAGDPRFRTAFDRWLRARRPDLSLSDHFIDLRVALEALYLNTNAGESTYRLSTRLAWHLGTTPAERREKFTLAQDFYRRASGIVHGAAVDDSDADSQLLQGAADLCRQGILVYLEAGPPDWDALTLGDVAEA